MSGPQRIQQRRTRGWRKPENTVSVARPSKWGNPFTVEEYGPWWAVQKYRWWVEGRIREGHLDLTELRGKNLMCWCPVESEDQPTAFCHADVLLELANPLPLCPECRGGKAQNCTGWTLDANDNETPCSTGEERSS